METKIALVSDVHGETRALAAVLAEARSEGVDRLWCLGDSVEWLLPRDEAHRGDPDALRLAAAWSERLLAGNHEQEMMADPLGRERLANEPDGDKLLALLESLPPRLAFSEAGLDVELVHASLTEPSWGLIEVDADVQANFAATAARLICSGHTHVPLAARLAGGEVEFLTPVLGPAEIDLSERLLVNPGSVGRSHDDHAWWAVLRLEDGVPVGVSWRRTPWQPRRLFR